MCFKFIYFNTYFNLIRIYKRQHFFVCLIQGWQEKLKQLFFSGFNHQPKPIVKAHLEKNANFAYQKA